MSPSRLIPVLILFASATAAADGPVDYARDVAPILRAYCAGCHNDDDFEGDLSVETFAQLAEGASKKTVRAGQPENSYLMKVIEGRSKPKMPPKDEAQPASADVALLKRWIAEGANPPAEDVSILSTLVVPEFASATETKPITAAASTWGGLIEITARYGEITIVTEASVKKLDGIPGKVTAIDITRDTKSSLYAGGITGLKGSLSVFTPSGKWQKDIGRDLIYDAEFSPDATLLAAAGYDRTIRLINADDGTSVLEIDGHKGAVFDLAFHPSGKALASASADGTVKLWRVEDGTRLDTLTGPAGEQFAVTFSKDGKRLIAAGADNRIRIWGMTDFQSPKIQPLLQSRFAHEGTIEKLYLSPDGNQLISAADDRSLKAWSLPDLVHLHTFETQPDSVSAIIAARNADHFMVTRMDGSTGEYTFADNDTSKIDAPEPAAPKTLDTVPSKPTDLAESEPNNDPGSAEPLPIPAEVKGAISSPSDGDLFRFEAAAGQQFVFEINAARSKSKLDSKLEVLHADGSPVEQVVLQAVRDSWFTFRGKDSNTSDDFRLHNWREMELNEFLYADGEVTKLWHYPRGPDSGFKVYPGFGSRHTYFQTTAVSHPLGAPAYIVRPFPPSSNPTPNGLPVYRLHFENDDDPKRTFGVDSRLLFTAPKSGAFLIRVSDVRAFGAEKGFHYALAARHARPAFHIAVAGKNPKLAPASGKELVFTATREDGFDGAIKIEISGVPNGYVAASPLTIGSGHLRTFGTLYAEADAKPLTPEETAKIQITATASPAGDEITKKLGDLGKIELVGEANLTVSATPLGGASELTIHPGKTIFAMAKADRKGFKPLIDFGKDDSGKSLPHGLYVDNIGLNGLMIVAGQTERQFAITAAPWVKPGEHHFFLSTKADGGRTSRPIKIRVLATE